MAWWDRMPRRLQGWLTIISILGGLLGAAFALGAATSGAVGDVRGLPVRMEAAEAQIQQHDTRLLEHDNAILATDNKLDRVVCLLLLPDSLSAIESERSCP